MACCINTQQEDVQSSLTCITHANKGSAWDFCSFHWLRGQQKHMGAGTAMRKMNDMKTNKAVWLPRNVISLLNLGLFQMLWSKQFFFVFLPVASSSIYTQPTVSLLSQPVLQGNSEMSSSLHPSVKTHSDISEIPVSREARKSKPSDWHRCQWKKKRGPLLLHVWFATVCSTVFVHACKALWALWAVCKQQASKHMQPCFSSVSVCFLPRKTVSQVPFTGFPWIVERYRYKSSNAARQPPLGSGDGVQGGNSITVAQ